MALALCAGILVTASYVPSLCRMLHLVSPDIKMWGIVLTMSLAPLLIGLIVRSFASKYSDKKHFAVAGM